SPARHRSALADEAREDGMVAAGEPLVDIAYEVGDRVREDRELGLGLERDAGELVRRGAREVEGKLLLIVAQNVDDEAAAAFARRVSRQQDVDEVEEQEGI